MKVGSSNHKGAVAEAKIAAAAAELGIPVLRPMADHGRYDMVFEIGRRLLRIQCKWATCTGDVVSLRMCTSRLTPHGYVKTVYTEAEVDAIAAYCADLDQCYLIPASVVDGRGLMHLRISPARNGQKAGVQFAEEFLFAGAVAQLEVAPEWHSGGRRFESGQLHLSAAPAVDGEATVGANELRSHFGLYMQRAAAGETINVTRRGKPFVRLTGAAGATQLDLAA